MANKFREMKPNQANFIHLKLCPQSTNLLRLNEAFVAGKRLFNQIPFKRALGCFVIGEINSC